MVVLLCGFGLRLCVLFGLGLDLCVLFWVRVRFVCIRGTKDHLRKIINSVDDEQTFTKVVITEKDWGKAHRQLV